MLNMQLITLPKLILNPIFKYEFRNGRAYYEFMHEFFLAAYLHLSFILAFAARGPLPSGEIKKNSIVNRWQFLSILC